MKLKNLFVVLAALGGFFIAQNSWATCANYATYTDGQVLTAASLNSLQTNYTNCTNNVLNGDAFTGSIAMHSGSDITFYSDAGSTATMTLEGTGGNITLINSIGGALSAGQFSNCGLTYGTATLSITDEAGAALSATNPCCIGVPGATAGQNGTICFTAAASSTFGAASDSDGNTFGVTATVDWGSDAPFFLYACRGSASNYFGFSRDPRKTSTGAAATDMCQEADEDCDAQGDLFIMASGLTLASEVNMPCQVVGSFTATWTTTDDNWVVTALDAADGFGRFQEGAQFTMPISQNGSASGRYFTSSNMCTFTTNVILYTVRRDGSVYLVANFSGDTATDGAAADAVQMPLPLASATTSSGQLSLFPMYVTNTGLGAPTIGFFQIGSAATYGVMVQNNHAAAGVYAGFATGNFSNGTRQTGTAGVYQAF